MPVPSEVAKQIAHLRAAIEMLSRIDAVPRDEQQGTRDARTIISALTHVGHVERWARRIVREVLDEMSDLDAAKAAAGRGGRGR